MEKEKWKDEVLNSIEGIRRAEPDPRLYEGIRANLAKSAQLVPRPWISFVAASFALLIFANVYALTQQKNEPNTATSVYQLDHTNFNLY